MIMTVMTMADSGLLFSSGCLRGDVCPLLRFCKASGSLLVTNSLDADRPQLAIVINRMTILIDGYAVNGGFTTDRIPLTAPGIFHDLIVTTGSRIAGGIIESCSGTIGITNLEMTVLTMGTIHMGYLTVISGHEVLERRLIVLGRLGARLKLRRIGLLLHGIPLDTIGCDHNRMGRIGFLEECTVVPEGVSTIGRACFDHAVANRPEHGAFLGTGECGSNQRSFRIAVIMTTTMHVAGVIVSRVITTGEAVAPILICISASGSIGTKPASLESRYRMIITDIRCEAGFSAGIRHIAGSCMSTAHRNGNGISTTHTNAVCVRTARCMGVNATSRMVFLELAGYRIRCKARIMLDSIEATICLPGATERRYIHAAGVTGFMDLSSRITGNKRRAKLGNLTAGSSIAILGGNCSISTGHLHSAD